MKRNGLAELLPLWLCIFLAGCSDPITDPVPVDATANVNDGTVSAAPISLSSRRPPVTDWPLDDNGWRISRQSPLSYLDSVDRSIECPDRLNNPILPWPRTAFPESIRRYFDDGFHRDREAIREVAVLAPQQLMGMQAFDLREDGRRLILLTPSHLVLYDMETGRRLGKRSLPEMLHKPESQPLAVRFCGSDFLVATNRRIVRISGRTGDVMASASTAISGIKQWIIGDDRRTMVMVSDQGALVVADCDLESIEMLSCDLGRVTTAALDADGARLFALVERVVHVSVRENREWSILRPLEVERDVRGDLLTCGIHTLAWAADGQLAHGDVASAARLLPETRFLSWKPKEMITCGLPGRSVGWLLITGTRPSIDNHSSTRVNEQGKTPEEQWVLYSFGPKSGNFSRPDILPQRPLRIASDADGDRVAILDSDGLRLCHRDPYRLAVSVHERLVHGLLEQGQHHVIEAWCRQLRRQQRLIYGRSPAQCEDDILQAVGQRWAWYERQDPDGPTFRQLSRWEETDSEVAKICSAVRHAVMVGQLEEASANVDDKDTAAIRDKIRGRRQRALGATRAAVRVQHPPRLAVRMAVRQAAESAESLERSSSLLRRSMDLYPGEAAPHVAMLQTLLHRRAITVEETLEHCRTLRRLHQRSPGQSSQQNGDDGDRLFLQVLAGAVQGLPADVAGADAEFILDDLRDEEVTDGLNALILQRRVPTTAMQSLFQRLANRKRCPQAVTRWNRYLQYSRAVMLSGTD